jgi:hypothetical protein
MAGKNDITGDRLINKVLTKEGEENWDRIFKKQGITLTEEELANVEIIADIVQHHHDKKQLPEYELDKATGEVVKVDVKKLTDAFSGH